jgi:hypothetical protein
MPSTFRIDQAQEFHRLLALSGEFQPPAGEASLRDWYTAWQAALPADADTRLRLLAAHDLRMCLHMALQRPITDFPLTAEIRPLLPTQGRRAFWESLSTTCEWTLPRMGLPAWAQTLFGVALLAGLILPFWFPVWGLLLLPAALSLSFFLENRVTYLAYPTLAAVANRMVQLNEPGIQLGKFSEEDVERVFYELACAASEQTLPLQDWEAIRLPAR